MSDTAQACEDARDLRWMRAALVQAQAAALDAEIPVGAVVVCGEQIIGVGSNAPMTSHDPTAHAEIVALRRAAAHLGNYRLENCELFVTLEPCVMCAGAILHARLRRVVFGTADAKTGAAGSVVNVFANDAINHHTRIDGGVLQDECAALLQEFFKRRRRHQALEKAQSGRALRDDALRTPQSRFTDLPDLPEPALYVNDLPALNGLRLHYIDTGPATADSARVYLHGHSSWSYVWRAQVAQAIADGERVVCPDLIGFGRSDKPKKASVHSLLWHAQCVTQLLQRLKLKHVTLVLPPEMRVLAQHLASTDEVYISATVEQQTDILSAQARDAPYLDPGHRVALRFFSATVG